MNRGKSWNARLKHYGPDSTWRSGVRRFPCTLWPSIKKSANAKSAALTHRLPELFCGFSRSPGKGPTLHPVACAPQAWAAGAVYLVLQSCLGLSVHAAESRICLSYPCLPESIQAVRIQNLCVGGNSIDLEVVRNAQSVSVDILRRTGNLQVRTIY
jgi:glycogen debranching enzyme